MKFPTDMQALTPANQDLLLAADYSAGGAVRYLSMEKLFQTFSGRITTIGNLTVLESSEDQNGIEEFDTDVPAVLAEILHDTRPENVVFATLDGMPCLIFVTVASSGVELYMLTADSKWYKSVQGHVSHTSISWRGFNYPVIATAADIARKDTQERRETNTLCYRAGEVDLTENIITNMESGSFVMPVLLYDEDDNLYYHALFCYYPTSDHPGDEINEGDVVIFGGELLLRSTYSQLSTISTLYVTNRSLHRGNTYTRSEVNALLALKSPLTEKVNKGTSAAACTIDPDKLYIWRLSSPRGFPVTLNVTLAASSDTDHVHEYLLRISVISNVGGISLVLTPASGTILWANNTAPTWQDGHTYEISIVDNLATFVDYQAE